MKTKKVKRRLHYIRDTMEYGITYRGNNKPIVIYSNADLEGDGSPQ